MTADEYGFYFEVAGRSATKGPVSPAEEFFEGSRAEVSVAREMGQNSLDAALGSGPVRMVFELRQMETDDIPDIESLRRHLAAVEVATREQTGHDRMLRASELANEQNLWVLRVGDYGTHGLRGSEKRAQQVTALVALTRGAGISSTDSARGGSFGIGSAVGTMASDLSTVLYASLADDKEEVVFAGYSRLASHVDDSNTPRQADGFFTLLDDEDDFTYLTDPDPIGPFAKRTALGTDTYILGYRKAEEDPGLEHLRAAFVDNFMLAIHRGRLVVEGITPHGSWTLDASTLQANLDATSLPFYRAMLDPDPYVGTIAGLGEVKLYADFDDTLNKKLNTITVRGPLMKIDTFIHHSVPAKYAAILDCSEQAVNDKLRPLEPPEHTKWDPGRAPYGEKVVKSLKKFVQQGLLAKVKTQMGQTVEIKGLARLLPAELWSEPSSGKGGTGRAMAGEPVEAESAGVQGDPAATQSPEPNPSRRAVAVSIRRPGLAGDGDPAEKGRDTGGSGERDNDDPGIDGTATEGEGHSRIPRQLVTMRSWSDPASGDIILTIRATQPVQGDLELAPLGPRGVIEEGYQLPITAAIRVDTDEHLEVDGNTIKGIALTEELRTVTIRLTLDGANRYRLGVK
ncbi:hypothetical protein [Propioniciclava sinopodophylli]|uniref:hypothetical protein n=1 Tax=Propioniciclava sinopodophylli TaxID=1837344 RepID=UPI00249107CA|nr:hypothetical protein [Propioniciclava sinopodophylli]